MTIAPAHAPQRGAYPRLVVLMSAAYQWPSACPLYLVDVDATTGEIRLL